MNNLCLLLLLIMSFKTLSQSTLPDIPRKETQIGILEALNENKPNLGMHILSVESGYHVLMSRNGRYMVKGSLWDLWDGVHESQVVDGKIPSLPPSLSPDQYFVIFGNQNGLPLFSYVKYGCNSCDKVIETLFSDDVLSKYKVHLMVLHNDPVSELVARHIYCSTRSKEKAVRDIFREYKNFNTSQLNGCKGSVSSSTPTAANAQGIKALPFTYFPEREYGVIGDMSGYL